MSDVPSPLDIWGGQSPSYPLPTALIARVLTQAADALGATITKILEWIGAQLGVGMDALTQLSTKMAAPIATGLNQTQAAIDQMTSAVQSSIQGQVAQAGAPAGAGGTVQSGAKWGQYRFNVASNRYYDPTKGVWGVAEPYDRNVFPTQPPETCFLAGFDEYLDAGAFATSVKYPYSQCPVFGGPARSGGVGGVSAPPVAPPETPATPPTGCTPADGVGPWVLIYNPNVINEPTCRVWSVGCSVPEGWTVIGGPQDSPLFPESLLQYCGQTNIPTGPTGPTGPIGTGPVSPICPPTQPPPPPPPCCDIKLPDCINITCCDWGAFSEAIYNALCKWYNECLCKLDNETSYILNECDPALARPTLDWLGKALGSMQQIASADDAIAQAASQLPRLNGQG